MMHSTLPNYADRSGTYSVKTGARIADKHGRRVHEPRSEAEVVASINRLLEQKHEVEFAGLCFAGLLALASVGLVVVWFLWA